MTVSDRLRKEAARGGAPDGTECCYAPWTCCEPNLLIEAATMLDDMLALLDELPVKHPQQAERREELRRIHQQLSVKED